MDISDPFREPATRWDGVRGQYERVTYTDPRGQEQVGYLFAPLNAAPGSLPGIMLMACNIGEFPQLGGMYWAAETVAEHGYYGVMRRHHRCGCRRPANHGR
jgi:hypothetical protein